jgi:hypothetical protein
MRPSTSPAAMPVSSLLALTEIQMAQTGARGLKTQLFTVSHALVLNHDEARGRGSSVVPLLEQVEEPFRLLDLPIEIRTMIYSALFSIQDFLELGRGK